MAKITKTIANKNAEIFETNYRIHREAVAAAEARVKDAVAQEEAAKAVLKDYAAQNGPTLFPEGVATTKISGDVVVQRRNGVTTYNFSLISKAEREYLMATYPNAFSAVKTRFVDGDDAKAQSLLKKCATLGDPTYIVTLSSNTKATKK